MFNDRKTLYNDRPAQYKLQKRVPFTVIELKDRKELIEWRARAEHRSLVAQAKRIESAISAFVNPGKQIAAWPQYVEPKKSWMTRAYNSVVNFFLNIKYNQ